MLAHAPPAPTTIKNPPIKTAPIICVVVSPLIIKREDKQKSPNKITPMLKIRKIISITLHIFVTS